MLVTARNFAAALITLDADGLAAWAKAAGLEGDYATLSQNDATRTYVQTCIDELNTRLNQWESIKQFRILDRDLSIEEGELTPSLKVKRKVVETRYAGLSRLDVRMADGWPQSSRSWPRATPMSASRARSCCCATVTRSSSSTRAWWPSDR